MFLVINCWFLLCCSTFWKSPFVDKKLLLYGVDEVYHSFEEYIQKQKHLRGTFPFDLICFAFSFAFNCLFLFLSSWTTLAPVVILLIRDISIRYSCKYLARLSSSSLCNFHFEYVVSESVIKLSGKSSRLRSWLLFESFPLGIGVGYMTRRWESSIRNCPGFYNHEPSIR